MATTRAQALRRAARRLTAELACSTCMRAVLLRPATAKKPCRAQPPALQPGSCSWLTTGNSSRGQAAAAWPPVYACACPPASGAARAPADVRRAPPQRMPAWWEWYSNVNPVAWSVYGLVASQLGDDYTYYVNTCAARCAEGRVRHPTFCCRGAGRARSRGRPPGAAEGAAVRSDRALPRCRGRRCAGLLNAQGAASAAACYPGCPAGHTHCLRCLHCGRGHLPHCQCTRTPVA